jgi:DnaK suppressor protein
MATKKAKKNVVELSRSAFVPYQQTEGEEYMSDAQLQHFAQILLKWRQELMEEVDRTVHHMKDELTNLPDAADRATQEEEFNLELRTRDRERKLIRKIDKTLDKIKKHDYGWCEACGIEIGIRRLEARPTATLCIDCKTLEEIKEKQWGT